MTSTIKLLRPEDVWHPRIGVPLGNKNRLKHGRYTGDVRRIRKVTADFERQAKALIVLAECERLPKNLPVDPADFAGSLALRG